MKSWIDIVDEQARLSTTEAIDSLTRPLIASLTAEPPKDDLVFIPTETMRTNAMIDRLEDLIDEIDGDTWADIDEPAASDLAH